LRSQLPITWKQPGRQGLRKQQRRAPEPGREPGQQQERGPEQAPARASCRKRPGQRQQPGMPAGATSSYESSEQVELNVQIFAGFIRMLRQSETSRQTAPDKRDLCCQLSLSRQPAIISRLRAFPSAPLGVEAKHASNPPARRLREGHGPGAPASPPGRDRGRAGRPTGASLAHRAHWPEKTPR